MHAQLLFPVTLLRSSCCAGVPLQLAWAAPDCAAALFAHCWYRWTVSGPGWRQHRAPCARRPPRLRLAARPPAGWRPSAGPPQQVGPAAAAMRASATGRSSPTGRPLVETGAPAAAVRANQRSLVAKAQKREMMMWEALREGLDEEMEKDPTVCLMGAPCCRPAAAALACSLLPCLLCSRTQQHALVGSVVLLDAEPPCGGGRNWAAGPAPNG